MRSPLRLLTIAIVATSVGLVAFLVAHLALVDIFHAESDLRLEWAALHVCLGTVLLSQILVLVTLWRAVRTVRDHPDAAAAV